MKCKKCDSALAKGAKCCTECGTSCGDAGEMAKCSCGNEQDVETKFCGDCGEPMAKAIDAAIDSALEELGKFAKATDNLGDVLEVPTDSFAKAELPLADEFDATELLGALLKAHNIGRDHAEAIGNEVRGTTRALGLLAKAVVAINGRLAEISRTIGEAASRPAAPKARLTTVVPIAKAATGLTEAQNDGSLSGDGLWKAALMAERAGKVEPGTTTKVQRWANRGATLDTLAKAEPILAAQIAAAAAGK